MSYFVPFAQMPTLTDLQSTAARKLVTGAMQKDVAADIGVSARTIRRWLEDTDFQQEMEELRKRINAPVEEAIAELTALTEEDAEEWQSNVESHLDFLKQAAKTARIGGLNSATKAIRRLKDIPDEALKPSDAVALLRASTELMRAAVEFESEALGLYALAERVRDDAKG